MQKEITIDFIEKCLTKEKIGMIEQTWVILKDFNQMCAFGEMSHRQIHLLLSDKYNICRTGIIKRLKPHIFHVTSNVLTDKNPPAFIDNENIELIKF